MYFRDGIKASNRRKSSARLCASSNVLKTIASRKVFVYMGKPARKYLRGLKYGPWIVT